MPDPLLDKIAVEPEVGYSLAGKAPSRPIGFLILVLLTVFAAITLYSRHVPEEWTTPIKGLSALIGAILALMGLKLDSKSETTVLGIKPSWRVSTGSLLLLAVFGTILLLEENHKLKITAYPGTRIYGSSAKSVGEFWFG